MKKYMEKVGMNSRECEKMAKDWDSVIVRVEQTENFHVV